MNKAFCKKRCISSLILAVCLIFFNLSCGLDTFYVIDGPTNVIHKPDCSSIDYSDSYFDFYTVDKSYDNIKFLGTEVYYKIYKSSTRLNSEADDLISIANKSDSASAAAERMIQSYKFQSLRAAGHKDVNVLIPTTGSNERINIRLSDYTLYPAQITVDGNNIYGSSSFVKPIRNLSDEKYFNFKASAAASSSNSVPVADEADVNTSGSSSDSDWYVSMFAVAVGQDSSYAPVYSNVLYLGSVRIPLE